MNEAKSTKPLPMQLRQSKDTSPPQSSFIIHWRRMATRFHGRTTALRAGHPLKVFRECEAISETIWEFHNRRCASSRNIWAAVSERRWDSALKAVSRRDFQRKPKL